MRIAQEEIFGPTTALIRVARLRRGGPGRERRPVRALVVDLHARREPRLPRDARPRGRDHVRQRGHDRRRGAPAVRRHEGHGQRPPRGRPGGARRLHRVEVDLRRLLRASCSGPRSTTREPTKLVVFVPPRRSSRARCGLRGARADRRLRALLLVHEGTARSVADRARIRGRRERGRRSASRAAARDGLPGDPRTSSPLCGSASVRGAGFDVYALPVKAGSSPTAARAATPGRPRSATCSRPRTAPCSARTARRSASRRTTSPSTAALVAGLERAVELGVDELEVVSDSELLVKQMRGEYRVKNEALRDLSLEAARLARAVGTRDVHGRAPRAQRARRPARERGPGPGVSYNRRRRADVAQLARASACHAEGRGFESLHPLLESPG